MGIAKKSSRPITVNEINYRWAFSVKWIDAPDGKEPSDTCWGRVSIIIAHADDLGPKIIATEDQVLLHYCDPQRTYKPNTIATLINYALENGWSKQSCDFKIPDISTVIEK